MAMAALFSGSSRRMRHALSASAFHRVLPSFRIGRDRFYRVKELHVRYTLEGPFSTTRSKGLSSGSNSGTWPLHAKFNDIEHREVQIQVEYAGRKELVKFAIDTCTYGSALTMLGDETLALLKVWETSPMVVNGVSLVVGMNGRETLNMLGADFFLITSAVIVADYTGAGKENWTVQVSRGAESDVKYSIDGDEVPVVIPHGLKPFQGLIDDWGWVWLCFPVKTNGATVECFFIVDTGSPHTWMTGSQLLSLGFTHEQLKKTPKGCPLVTVSIGGVHTLAASSDEGALENPVLLGRTILGTCFFADGQYVLTLNYKSKTIKIE